MKVCRFLAALGLTAFLPGFAVQYEIFSTTDFTGGMGASDINNRSWMAGGDGPNAGVFRNGIYLNLGRFAGDTFANANAINEHGIAVGHSALQINQIEYRYRAFIWYGSGEIQPIAGGWRAHDINELGQVAGESSGAARGFFWQNGALTQIGTFGGTRSDAYAINNLGQVVGRALDPQHNDRAFRWQNGVLEDVSPFGRESIARDINDSGFFVGVYTNTSRYRRAFMSDGKTATDLGSLGGPIAEAEAVNDIDQVVGWAQNQAGSSKAFLWENGAMVSLESLLPQGHGWTLRQAHSINDGGEILGTGIYGGETRAFYMRPVSENTNIILLAALMLVFVRSRHRSAKLRYDLLFRHTRRLRST